MAEFRMPSLGADMDEGTLLEWRVKPGDRIARGQIVALVDTDKAEIEIECWQAGVVERLIAEVGQTLPVGAPLAWLREDGAAAEVAPAPALAQASAPAPPVPAPRAPVTAPSAPARPAPTQAALPAPAPTRARVRATPLARRLAQERGLDLAALTGSGPGGAIVVEDVRAAAAGAPVRPAAPVSAAVPAAGAAAPPAAAEPAAAAPRDRREGMRRAIAAAMARSKREIPHYYLSTPFDCGPALAWLRERNQTRPVTERVLPIALLIAATAKALRKAPDLCGFYENGAFRKAGGIHVGVAVSLRGGGLIAPALRNADALRLDDLMRELAALTSRVRDGRLRSSELSDAAITVTSLGDLGVESVFPVIYPPQVAIVGFGRIADAPIARDGMLAVHPVVRATLAADHRVSDGMRGARFLAEIGRLLGRPEEL
jgi:pyruvate dehydrogenase E2 component (dihydrolipoamide acetyltransferase)